MDVSSDLEFFQGDGYLTMTRAIFFKKKERRGVPFQKLDSTKCVGFSGTGSPLKPYPLQ